MAYDVYKIRELFPMLRKDKTMQGKPLIFLDNASTTFKPRSVIDACSSYYEEHNSNSHRGDYDLAYGTDMMVQKTRDTIAKFLNCDSREVVFTSGDTQALNLLAYGYALKFLKEGDEILLSIEEHASNLLPWFKVAQLTKAKVSYIPLNKYGQITVQNLKKAISSKTKIVSVAHVSNVLGYTVDIKEFAKIAHQFGAVMVVDGAQSVPHNKIDFKDLDIDFLTFSAHKMCGPTGIGCLIGKYDLLDRMDSFSLGGGMNVTFHKDATIEYLNPPQKFEGGTLNLSGIYGFKAAVEFLMDLGMDNIHAHEVELQEYALKRLEGYKNIHIYNAHARGGIITFNIEGVFSQDEATLFNHKGIAIRSGLHCAKMLPEFLGVPSTCRASFYLYTTKEEVDAFVDALINGGDILDAYFS